MRGMTIGEVAKAAGVGVETIRYYQRRGLLATPERPLGSVRRYADEILGQLSFIRRSQDLGFTLDEISVLFQVRATDCGVGQQLAKDKHVELGERIQGLVEMRARLGDYLDRCTSTAAGPCPFISMLNGSAD